ncbi:FAD/NAD-P-binding domain-containing protein [Mycena sanguinolenta]|uniref:FAD/NAD-P-binding domain-containing protein n=1 Tax=Mycena sanguinolenta TaxID=230812 RepID=A0A8H7DMS1_9AGAR|nr:FAD/NAD-P-binding domain-containing protein [Mycena sanguinolenta]
MWPFSNPYRQFTVNEVHAEYDFIILGGGNAGCVLARRLSESGKYTVLLIEKGDTGDSWLHRTPLTSHHFMSDGKHSTVFDSAVDLNLGRSVPLINGHGLGGTTRINGGQYTLGVPAEYNAWSEEGRPGWSYTDLKPYFTKSETWVGPVPEEWHGSTGPLTVRSFEGYFYGCSKATAKAASDLGFVPILDMHSPLQPSIGWNKMQFALGADGTRQSSFRSYLPRTFVNSVGNLHICTRAVASKLTFSRQTNAELRADCVEVQSSDGRVVRVVKARREIVLTCGALQTPKILLLSGIGPKEHLEQMGIETVRHMPGIGANLQDHLFIRTTYNCPLPDSLWAMFIRPWKVFGQLYNYLRHGTGWFLGTAVEVEIFGMASLIDSDGRPNAVSAQDKDPFNPNNRPDFAVMATPIADPSTPGIAISKGSYGQNCALMKAESRGQVLLRSKNPMQNPLCEMRYLTHPKDWATLRTALRVSVQLGRQMRANGYSLDDILVPSALDNDTLDTFIRERAETMYHYTSSCRMAPEADPLPGVVDPELRVHGVSNLRISDASILPSVPAVHPQALVYAVAEKCADMMLKD